MACATNSVSFVRCDGRRQGLISERTGRTGRRVVYDAEGHVAAVVSGVPDVPMAGYSPGAASTFYNGSGDPVLSVDETGRFTASTFNADHKPLALA